LIENRPGNWALPENVTPDGVDLFLLPLEFEFAGFLLPVFEAGLFDASSPAQCAAKKIAKAPRFQ